MRKKFSIEEDEELREIDHEHDPEREEFGKDIELIKKQGERTVKDNAKKNVEDEDKETKTNKKIFIIGGFVVVVLIILISSMVISQKNKEKLEEQKRIEQREKEKKEKKEIEIAIKENPKEKEDSKKIQEINNIILKNIQELPVLKKQIGGISISDDKVFTTIQLIEKENMDTLYQKVYEESIAIYQKSFSANKDIEEISIQWNYPGDVSKNEIISFLTTRLTRETYEKIDWEKINIETFRKNMDAYQENPSLDFSFLEKKPPVAS